MSVLVCHCKVVYDRHVREAIAAGARDEVAVGRACGAGTGCGGCVPAISRLLGECADCPLAASPDAAEHAPTTPTPALAARARGAAALVASVRLR